MTLLYEDGACRAELLENGATLGHIKITPKKTVSALDELSAEESAQLFWVASFAATGLFEGMGAHGTNILCTEGDEVAVHVLARTQEDGLDLFWEPKKAEPAELETMASRISEQLWYVGKEESSDSNVSKPTTTKTVEEVDPSKNYKLKQLIRGM